MVFTTCYSVRLVRTILLRFAKQISKGITLVVLPILFSCQGTDFRKRAPRLPPLHFRVKRNISCRVKRFRLARTAFFAAWKERRAGQIVTSDRRPLFPALFQRTNSRGGTQHNALPPTPIPAIMHKCLCTRRLAPPRTLVQPDPQRCLRYDLSGKHGVSRMHPAEPGAPEQTLEPALPENAKPASHIQRGINDLPTLLMGQRAP